MDDNEFDEQHDWGPEETARVAASYYAYWAAPDGPNGDKSRQVREQHFWAELRVSEAAMEDALPLEALDALLHAGDDASPLPAPEHWPPGEWDTVAAYRDSIGAGPLETLLSSHSDRHDAAIAARCRTDPAWAQAAGGVWMDRERWEQLPTDLQRVILEPPQEPARKPRKRPSKRQDRRGRNR